MSVQGNPYIITEGLQIHLDATNLKSYPGSGNGWYNLASTGNWGSTSGYHPTVSSDRAVVYFSFVNDGVTINTKYTISPGAGLYNQTEYTRIGWFYLTSYSNAWSPIMQNAIGNNSDMGLTVYSNGKLHFRQYTKTYSNGTVDGDYGVSGVLTVSTGRWYMGTIVVSRVSNTVTFYLNDQFDSTSSINVLGVSSTNWSVIGGCISDDYGGDRMFKGRIAAVYHYNRLLSGNEVRQIYNANRSRFGL